MERELLQALMIQRYRFAKHYSVVVCMIFGSYASLILLVNRLTEHALSTFSRDVRAQVEDI